MNERDEKRRREQYYRVRTVSRESILREVEKIDKEALERKEKIGKKKGKGKQRIVKILSEEEEEEEDSEDELAFQDF